MSIEIVLDKPSKKIDAKILERSKLTAIKMRETFPEGMIYPFKPYHNNLDCYVGWKTHEGFTINEIISFKQPAIWGIKMSSVPLVVFDFDIKSEMHKRGMTEERFKELLKLFKIEKYPCVSKSKSGKGGHIWFLDDNALLDREGNKIERGMQFIEGLDYKARTIVFLNEYPFPKGLNDLKKIPEKYFSVGKKPKPNQQREQREFGPGQNNKAIPQRAGVSGAKKSLYQATLDIVELFEKNKNRIEWNKEAHTQDYLKKFLKSWGYFDEHKKEIIETTKLQLRMHTKQKITDTQWRINQWIEQGFCLIAGPPGSGKSTLAIKIAVLNALKRTFWVGGGTGDGRKSLYICFERQKNIAFNKEIACGGYGEEIDIANDFIDDTGKTISINLEDETHINIILHLIKTNNYAFVIFDPVVDLVLSNQNDNAKVRKAFNSIFDYIEKEKLDTTLLGIAHLRKERTNVDDIGSIRGAGEFVNIANAVLKTRELKDNAGYLLYRLKVNQAQNTKKGAVKYKIENCTIPEKFLAEGSKEKTKGGIKVLNYEDKPVGLLQKDCVEDIPNPHKETYFDKVQKVIDRMNAEDKVLDTTVVRKLARAEGVSKYYLNTKIDWTAHGYTEHSTGQGRSFRIVLVPKKL